jgi:hypothetical protein
MPGSILLLLEWMCNTAEGLMIMSERHAGDLVRG